MKWAWRRDDGEPVTCLRITHMMSRDDLVNLLAAHWAASPDDELSKSEVVKRVREQLERDASQRFYWHEQMPEDEARELTDWAQTQVSRL